MTPSVGAPPDITFACPPQMEYWSRQVFDGEYSVNYSGKAPRVLDIGANCGAFSIYATQVWPGCSVYAYEPAQVCFSFLSENVKPYPNITAYRAAVMRDDALTKLYIGKTNQGEASFFSDLGQTEDTYETPPLIHPSRLPACDILKVDTEGCEAPIIEGLLEAGQEPQIIMFEYHREDDRRFLDLILGGDYLLTGAEAKFPHRGVLKYVRRQP